MIAEQILTEAEVKDILDKHTEFLSAEFAAVDTTFEPEAAFFKGQWSEMGRPSSDEVTTWDTGLDWAILEHVAEHSVQVPEGFVSVLTSQLISDRFRQVIRVQIL